MITRELAELKHKVFSQRIDRLYNIFNVLSQDEQHVSKLNAIKVIKEQYDKMYNTIIEKEAFDKYEEVENTIMPKLAQIEHQLDVHIYRTSKKCEELLDGYIKEIEKYDNYNNLDGELEKIKALKEILKLYRPYINQEQEEKMKYKISAIKFDILLRKQIQGIKQHDTPNLLNQYDSKEERKIFESLLRERFKSYVDSGITQGMKVKEIISQVKQQTDVIMRFTAIIDMLLIREIKVKMETYKKRFQKAHSFMRILYKTEKINKKIDTTEILNMQAQIQEYQEQLDEVIANNEYNKYLEIRANIIPKLEEYERRIDEMGGIDYILDTVISKEYHLNALLEEIEETPRATLEYVMELYNPDKLPEEDGRYNKAEKMYELRDKIRTAIKCGDKDSILRMMRENPELEELFELPIFDKSVLNYNEELDHIHLHFYSAVAKFEYLSNLTNGKFSIFDWLAFENIHEPIYYHRIIKTRDYMNYSQKLVWDLYAIIRNYSHGEMEQSVYYLIQLDEEVVTYRYFSLQVDDEWPINGEEFYKVVNFNDVHYKRESFYDLRRLYVKTKQLLIKRSEIKLPLDESKMRKVSDEEAELLKQTVKKASLEDNVDNILNNIFDLWTETQENKERRDTVKKAIRNELIKMGTGKYSELRIQKIECHELYEAIKNEIHRIIESLFYYKNFQSNIEKVVHLISFIYEFLKHENLKHEKDFEEFGDQVEFELLLRLQFERILYKSGGKYSWSEFHECWQQDLGINFFGPYHFAHFRYKLYEYFDRKRAIYNEEVLDNDKVNEILLEDMKARPEKYLFVLEAPEENSIVPQETREKIAECAKKQQAEER